MEERKVKGLLQDNVWRVGYLALSGVSKAWSELPASRKLVEVPGPFLYLLALTYKMGSGCSPEILLDQITYLFCLSVFEIRCQFLTVLKLTL